MCVDDWVAHSRLKRPHGDDNRERSTPAPPEAQLPQADVSSRTPHYNNVIAPGSEVNMSRLRIRPNKAISPPKVRHRPPVVARLATNVARGVCTFLTSFPSTRVATWAKTIRREGKNVRLRQSGFRSRPLAFTPLFSSTGPRRATFCDLRFRDRIDLREPAAGRTSRSSRNPAGCVMPTPNAQRPEPFLCEAQMGPPTAGSVKACAV